MAQVTDIIDRIGKRITETGLRVFTGVYKKAGDIKTKRKISRIEKKITEDYKKLGYLCLKDENSILFDDIAPVIKESTDLLDEITRLRKEINEIKKVHCCLYCGAAMKDRTKFCPYCGKEITYFDEKSINNDNIEDISIEIFSSKYKKLSRSDSSSPNINKISIAESRKLAKLNKEVNKKISQLNANCIMIGKKYYDELNASPSANITSIISRISENKKKITEVKNRPKRIKTAITCPDCRREMSEFYDYCPDCGCYISEITSEILGSSVINDQKYHRVTGASAICALLILVCVIGNQLFFVRSYNKTIDLFIEACYTNDTELFYSILPEEIINSIRYCYSSVELERTKDDVLMVLETIMPNKVDGLDHIYGRGWSYQYKIEREASCRDDEMNLWINNSFYNFKKEIKEMKSVEIVVSIINEGKVTRKNTFNIILGKQGRDWYLLSW